MSIFDDDLSPGDALIRDFHGQSGKSRITLTEALLAAIADELHCLNQQFSDRNL